MRRAAKIDDNQREIVETLRAVGASVRSLSAVGSGFPDLAVGFRGKNYLLEVKRAKAKGQQAGALTEDQEQFFEAWRGHVAVVRTPQEALAAIGAMQ